MPKGYDYAYGAGPGGGLGNKHGEIGSPLDPCPYTITPGGGASQKGGEPDGPFGQHMQSPSVLPIVGRDSLKADSNAGGSIVTPMDTATTMPGVTGSSGTGASGGGGAKISSPLGSPWGDSVG